MLHGAGYTWWIVNGKPIMVWSGGHGIHSLNTGTSATHDLEAGCQLLRLPAEWVDATYEAVPEIDDEADAIARGEVAHG